MSEPLPPWATIAASFFTAASSTPLDPAGAPAGVHHAYGRKNYLFVGSQAGGRAAAVAYTPIGTAKLCGADPEAWLVDTLARIPDHKITRLDEFTPWNHSSAR